MKQDQQFRQKAISIIQNAQSLENINGWLIDDTGKEIN